MPQTARQMGKGTERERNLGKFFFKKDFFENSFYLIQFSCGLVPPHHTKTELKLKSQKSENKQTCCRAQNWIKICDLSQTDNFFGKHVYVTVFCSLHNLIRSDLKPKNINKEDMYSGQRQ